MLVANLAAVVFSHATTFAAFFFQDQQVAFDPLSLWRQMGWVARAVVIILFIMSAGRSAS
jgi:biopolymer transport protein ExbB/biopolymer transport protein TolQ